MNYSNGHNGTNGHANGTNGHANGHTGGNRITLPRSIIGGTSTPVADRVPPQNIEAEQAVLGSILLDAEILADVRSVLTPADFFRDAHQIIYRGMLRVVDAGSPLDWLTLDDELQRRDEIAKVGGPDYLHTVIASVPHSAHGRYYAQVVKESATAREILHAANEIVRQCYANTFTADELVTLTGESYAKIASKSKAKPDADGPVRVATLADVKRVAGETRWIWPGWIVDSHMSLLAAEPGTGKTRLAADLCRRIWRCEPWPDGEMATFPLHTPTLWVAADRNHGELIQVAKEMGLPDEALYLNSDPDTPTEGLKLDDPLDVAMLARRIEAVRPGLVIIDTINKATRRLLYRPEEAEAFFGPLLDVAMRTRTAILALTHLSKSGDPLDRRIEGTTRCMWKLERPQGESDDSNRRKLKVAKSFAVYPRPLDVEMDTEGNRYSEASHVPEPSTAPPKTGRPATAIEKASDWIRLHLAGGPAVCSSTKESALAAGHALRTFERAIKALGVITGGSGIQFYRLPTAEEERARREAPEEVQGDLLDEEDGDGPDE